MKTLILNGSPHKSGDTAAVLQELEKHLPGEITRIDAYSAGIQPCIDCRRCKTGACAFRDLDELFRDMSTYDAIVLASPLYFSEMTGMLLNLISRFEYFYLSGWLDEDRKRRETPRRGAVILLGGGSTKDCSAALSTGETVLRQLGAELTASLCYIDTDNIPAAQHPPVLEQAKTLAALLCG